MADLIQFAHGFGVEDIIAWGTTGLVCLDAVSQTVVKTPHDTDNHRRLEVEKIIYERFEERGGHRGVLRYFGPYDSGIRLELPSNWSLSTYLHKYPESGMEQRLCWADQITDALCFVHASNVIHGDITLNNIFLTQYLEAKLGDYAGSSIDGSDLLVSVQTNHRYPGPLLSISADIFALGSTLYNILTGKSPYQDLLEVDHAGQEEKDIREHEANEEIAALFSESKFPNTDSLGAFGVIVKNCWQVKYKSAAEVHREIRGSHVQHAF